MLIDINLLSSNYLEHYQETILKKLYTDALEGYFCSDYVIGRWVKTEFGGLINYIK